VQIALVGHFKAAHPAEKFKPTETMWLSCEMWDDIARTNNQVTRRGARINAVGTLISSKWVDKNSGEERKQFRFRISKLVKDEEHQHLVSCFEEHSAIPIEAGYDQTIGGMGVGSEDQSPSTKFDDVIDAREQSRRFYSKRY
jgi:single-stranded DNA-binding protein